MSQSTLDDEHLRATEAQMRRSFGLQESSSLLPSPTLSMSLPGGTSPQRRRFVRNGEVPVTVVHREHRDENASVNQLDLARQALSAQAVARERAERSLDAAQVTILDLQTKLGHERLAKDETVQALQRAEANGQAAQRNLLAVQQELVAERLDRQKADRACEQAIAACHVAEESLRAMIAPQQAQTPPEPVDAKERPKAVGRKPNALIARDIDRKPHTKAGGSPTTVEYGSRPKQTRGRGRPAKVGNQESKVVEWWVPGWRKKVRS